MAVHVPEWQYAGMKVCGSWYVFLTAVSVRVFVAERQKHVGLTRNFRTILFNTYFKIRQVRTVHLRMRHYENIVSYFKF